MEADQPEAVPRRRRGKPAQHFLLDPREYNTHFAEGVDFKSVNLRKLEQHIAPDVIRYHGRSLIISSNRKRRSWCCAVWKSTRVYHEEHELTLRMPHKTSSAKASEQRKIPVATRGVKMDSQRARPSTANEALHLPKMEFWSGVVPKTPLLVARAPPGPPPKAARRQLPRTWVAGGRAPHRPATTPFRVELRPAPNSASHQTQASSSEPIAGHAASSSIASLSSCRTRDVAMLLREPPERGPVIIYRDGVA